MFETFIFLVLFLVVAMLFSEPKNINRNNFATDEKYQEYLDKQKRKRHSSSKYTYNNEGTSYCDNKTSSYNSYDYNSATGLPMNDGGVDIAGNVFGTS